MPKKENFHSISLEFPDDMMDALLFYLSEKGTDLNAELQQFLLKLYEKTVPKNIKEYLAAKKNSAANRG